MVSDLYIYHNTYFGTIQGLYYPDEALEYEIGGDNVKHPEKWRDTVDPFDLPFDHFTLKEVIGYPHAGNDVFQVRGIFQNTAVDAYIKVARQRGADIKREIDTISALNWGLLPEIIDYDERKEMYVVTLAKEGERLSTILGNNETRDSMDYLYEYGQTLARLHQIRGVFPDVNDRRFFHMPPIEQLVGNGLGFVYDYLTNCKPQEINRCFCHGDFHYANILWKDKHISGILDFELAGIGNKEFDIAWALILRPGQRFLKTEEEISLFMQGYFSYGFCNLEYVRYYMVLIYAYFMEIGGDIPGYQEYVRNTLKALTV